VIYKLDAVLLPPSTAPLTNSSGAQLTSGNVTLAQALKGRPVSGRQANTQRCAEQLGHCSRDLVVCPGLTFGWPQELSTLLQLLDADPTMHEVIHDPNAALTLLARELTGRIGKGKMFATGPPATQLNAPLLLAACLPCSGQRCAAVRRARWLFDIAM
jgi:hypothetical protein